MAFKLVLLCLCSAAVIANAAETLNFNKDFYTTWTPDSVNTLNDGLENQLILTQASGSGFAYNDMFLFGKIEMEIKLIPGNSAGTVVAFYLASDQPNRDELDFEFLGNVSGQPITVQTNIFADGFDRRRERINLWFDPAQDYHKYSIFWNIYYIIFYVDDIPIRVHKNYADKGIAFPRRQPMGVFATIWDGENWATQDGKIKIDWNEGPFVASFRNFNVEVCPWKGNRRFCRSRSAQNWWNKRTHSTLNDELKGKLEWARSNYLIYDYCTDTKIINTTTPDVTLTMECTLSKY
ncbi:hypothetical protein SUGI_0535590 [Cryptomeria japonica]|nr:hypothetical protein SUGI_0535590 [Cryptomeria japonica]